MLGPTDEDLIVAFQAGDTDSLGILVERWERPLFRFAFRLLERTEDARDVCQETFLRVFNRANRFKQGARFSTWMYQIALNLCRDQLRRRRRWRFLAEPSDRHAARPTDLGAGSGLGQDPAEAIERQERRRAVARALETLPAEQREVLVLKEFEGLKFREIAEILRCPESTVKSRMYYGLSALKTALVNQGVRAS